MKVNKGLAAIVAAVAVLAFAFWFGGSAPGLHGWTAGPVPTPTETAPPTQTPKTTEPLPSLAPPSPTPLSSAPTETPRISAEPTPSPSQTPETRPDRTMPTQETGAAAPAGSSAGVEAGDAAYSETQGMALDPATGKDHYLTDPVPEGKPLPVEPEDVTVSEVAYTCTLSVQCGTILNNLDWLNPDKTELVPEDGVIFPATQVTFYEGESVFNVLHREMKLAKIHMEFKNTPIYNSAYIKGIHNLYEFDCGELSGWMYKVNGWFPNYGCSRYQLQDGDTVEWVYTCDLGSDVGGYYSTGS